MTQLKSMTQLKAYSLPAFIQDFPVGSAEDIQLKARWDINVTGWIAQAMPAEPSFFYAPTQTDIPEGTPTLPVSWGAFPGRLDQYFSAEAPNPPPNIYNLTQDQVYSLADLGQYQSPSGTSSFPQIPTVICPQANWEGSLKDFGPYGPRGWLDEYCEWSATRDAAGDLVRVDFACENPEYWNTLWKVSPERVREIYEQTLNYDAPTDRQISVALEDLQLTLNGAVVVDPETGGPVYNPLNKWNSGPVSVRTGAPSGFTGGVMHLTSTPNTLQTELGLAGAATVQYASGNSNQQALICCAQYGQEYRHSDPLIGQSVNQAVGGQITGGNNRVCLADPVGLYLQDLFNPAAFGFSSTVDQSQLPAGAQASDVFQVVRGAPVVIDPVTGEPFPGQMNLHIVCQIPSAWLAALPSLTLADIEINQTPIVWAGQIANQFKVGLYARPLSTKDVPPVVGCSSGIQTPGQPLQCMFSNVFNGYYNNVEIAPTGVQMSLANNSTMIAPQLAATGETYDLALTTNTPSGPIEVVVLGSDGNPDPQIEVNAGPGEAVTYAIPGNSYPGNYYTLQLQVMVATGAVGGLRAIQVTDPKGGTSVLPAALYVLAGA